jgi:hypothetical protein
VLPRLNLTAVLAVVAVLDLVLHRVLGRLVLAGPALATPGGRALAVSGSFASYLAATLGLFIFASSFVRLLRSRALFPRSLRFAASVFALFFVVLLALSLSFSRLPETLLVQLKTSHAFLSWFVAAAVWRLGSRTRSKIGVTLLALPAVLHAAALFMATMRWGRHLGWGGDLARAGEVAALAAAALAPVLLPPEPLGGRYKLMAWPLGIIALTVTAAGLLVDFDLFQMVALHGFRLEVPAPGTASAWAYGALLLAASVGFAVVVSQALVAGGRERLLGLGVLLLGAAGYELDSPPALAVSACGMLAVAASFMPDDGEPAAAEAETAAPTASPAR